MAGFAPAIDLDLDVPPETTATTKTLTPKLPILEFLQSDKHLQRYCTSVQVLSV